MSESNDTDHSIVTTNVMVDAARSTIAKRITASFVLEKSMA